MLTLMTSMIAVSLLVQPADSLVLSGVVVDPAGKPVSDVEVVLAGRIPADQSVPTLARTMTDKKGKLRIEVARQKLKDIGPFPFLWAYRPGRAVSVQPADLTGNAALAAVRLTLAEPLKRTVTVLDPDGHPLEGVRLAPVLYATDGRDVFRTPDDRLERLTIATGADGVANLPYFPPTIDPLTVLITAPGIASHHLGLPDRSGRDRIILNLGRPARLAGFVYNESGQPASDVPIEVWAMNTYDLRRGGGQVSKAMLPPRLIPFDPGPVRTRADGSFLTPPQLLTGSSYRIIIRAEGNPLVTSDWVAATTERTTVPPLRLQQQRKLRGLVHDRQGKPVAGARVFLPWGEPATTTDAQGRYLLEGVLPDKTDQERGRKRAFLELATIQARAPAVGGHQADRRGRLSKLHRVANGWLNLGEVDQARPLIRDGLELIAALTEPERYHTEFLSTAARAEPDRVLSLIRGLSSAGRRRSCYAAVAESLANEHPAEAERVFQLVDGSSRVSFEHKTQIALRLCRRLAKTDPARARRMIASLEMPGDQACGWALVALGLAERDKPAARSALAESIKLIDHLLDSTEAAKRPSSTRQIRVANNPAASILPIVEQVAPERVEEVFWRAVALVRKHNMARQVSGVVEYRVIDAALFLARYDRQVADVFVTQAMSSQSRSRMFYSPEVIRAKASIDPQAAAALMETLPPSGLDPSVMMNRLTNEARDELLIYLVEPGEDHWKYLWSSSGIPLGNWTFP